MSGRLVLLRHGQTHGNVERRLDTRPPGAELTELGREQARVFARTLVRAPALIAHSVATRSAQTAVEIREAISPGLSPVPIGTRELEGIHEVQVGDLENRSDEGAHELFRAVYQRWHGGEHGLPLPGGETAQHVLDRYLPVLHRLRMHYLDDDAFDGDIVVVSHGAAIRLVSAVLAGVDASFAIEHHLANAESVVLAPITEGRWSCLRWGNQSPPFGSTSAATPAGDKAGSAHPMG